MDRELVKDYTLRISQANRSEIIVILYELTDRYLKEAIDSINEGKMDEFVNSCQRAGKCVGDLLEALDFSYELAFPLMRIYTYARKEITLAEIKRKADNLPKLKELLASLGESFIQVAKSDKSPAIMGNTETVYAGLTYGRGSLNESIAASSGNRGYMV